MATSLSAREMTVLPLSARGYSNREIAHRLGISIKTVEAHKSNGMRKLNLKDRVDLVHHAVREGWFNPDDESADTPPVSEGKENEA